MKHERICQGELLFATFDKIAIDDLNRHQKKFRWRITGSNSK